MQPVTAQEAAIQALQAALYQKADDEALENALWQTILVHQGVLFRTATGLPFTYSVKRGRNGQFTHELLIDRRKMSKTLAWSSIRMAFANARQLRRADRPKALGDIRGVSYVYPLLWHFGVLEVPQRRVEKMITDSLNDEKGGSNRMNKTGGATWETVRPEQEGLNPRCIVRMLDRLREKKVDVVSMMVLRHGKLLAEAYWSPYMADQLRTVYSFSKTFTAMAIGIAEGEGILSLDERIVDIFPEKAKKVPQSPELSALTIRHLLTMSTGQPEEPFHQENAWQDMTAALMSEPFQEQPGQVFRYNTAATYVLSAVLKQKGIDLEEYLEEKLLRPMGIQGTRWQRDDNGICTGGFGFSLHPTDMARLGQLMLQGGQWDGQQLVPAAYIQAASHKQIENGDDPNNDWAQGYGYQMWMCRHGAFRADGMYGQFCLVHPQTQSLLVTNCITDNTGEVMAAYWDEILAQYQPQAVPEDDEGMALLKERTANLTYARPVPEDDGGKVPEKLLKAVFQTTCRKLVMEGDVLCVTSESGEVWYEAERGAWRTIWRDADGRNMRVQLQRPVRSAYGMKDGCLKLRMDDVEFINEMTLLVWPEGEKVHVQLFGSTTHDGNPGMDVCVDVPDAAD